MKTSAAGRLAIEQREGVKLHAYQDEEGIWTIGFGHTAAAGRPIPFSGMVITNVDADTILTSDLVPVENIVNHVVEVPLTQSQFDACVSLCYNIGSQAFSTSTVVARLNEDDYVGAANAFLMWDKPKDLLNRRMGERAQFLGT